MRALPLLLAGLACLLAPGGAAAAAPAPAWNLSAQALPANLAPGGGAEYLVLATDVGAAPTAGTSTLTATVPAGLTIAAVSAKSSDPALSPPACATTGQVVECETSQALHPGRFLRMMISVEVPPATPPGTLELAAGVSGGGAASGVERLLDSPVGAAPVPFGPLPSFAAPLSEADGAPASAAGSHPDQLTVDLAFPTETAGILLTGTEHPHDIVTKLPRGLLGDPAALPVLCSSAELASEACPDPSQVGFLDVTTLIGGSGNTAVLSSPLYAMVPPPGAPAAFATNIGGFGLFAHLTASVRSDGDYGIDTASLDTLAIGNPIFAIQAQLWGDPSAHSHDGLRRICVTNLAFPGCSFEVPSQPTAFLTMPSDCPGTPIATAAAADSWEHMGTFREAGYQSADLAGNPVSVSGCNQLSFAPTISAQPTTDLVDSPSGLDFDLHQPQDFRLGHRATAELRDAAVTLPEGMSVNPAQADGLGACTSAQIGLRTPVGQSPVHFTKAPQSCPEAAKLGTVEVTSPLLVQRDAGHRLLTDPETGEPLPEPLHGSVYLAKPFDNPFGSLVAIYLAVEDPRTGTIAKLAGRVEPDPATGQLTTRFAESPELPLEDVRLHLFGGNRSALITPPSCATHTTTSELVPWSAPEGAAAGPSDSFALSASPAGGACPAGAAAAANAPAFDAGTLDPQAGAYSPFVLKLSREDGSQHLAGIDTTLPPGLTGKLAGVAECPEARIARAASRSNPEEGVLEREDPSCPASSQVGVVNVGAGAGPTPFFAQGHAYLAGPYKGAPLSLAIVTPAIAGPFDLGTVVVRTALYVDPFTAQIHAVSDPFPQILDGIPLDLRSVALRMDRPDFTLNPTSCNPLAITGQAVSALGQAAALNRPFQVGGCGSLGFKPTLTLKLKGGTKRSQNPSLTARLTYPSKGAYANIASAQVNLPHSEFLEQSHIRTVCTRPQLASHSCPPASVYGHAEAVSPLLDKPLEGPVYLGVGFGHTLPDLVADLNGQIEVLLHGKTDTGKNHGLRNTFQVVPDAPVSSFTLTLLGGKRGLIVNSENLCGPHAKRQAFAHFTAQNGAVADLKPKVQNQCGKKGKKKRHGDRHRRR